MLFNSFAFALFLTIVFLLHWLLPRKLSLQNVFLLIASYFFYAWWDYRFLALLVGLSLINFLIALALDDVRRSDAARRALLLTGLIINLGTLILFKYLGFFAESFALLLNAAGLRASFPLLKLILPLGISYYTFQMIAYLVDVYRKQLRATRDAIAFLLFASFFPKLIAGPIERGSNLLAQLESPREFQTERAKDGLRQFLWGLFKKSVIADNLAAPVDYVYQNYHSLDGATLFAATFLFAMQIYCDFSGYSDMALGTARLFNIELMQNFAYPYFSRDIAEFWRRWHISLSTWFRDYVFFPLGSLRRGKLIAARNVVITFTLSGLWHGADWTYVFWGLLNGLYLVPQVTRRPRRMSAIVAQGKFLPNLVELRQMMSTFLLVMLAWVFFRAPSLHDAMSFLTRALVHSWMGSVVSRSYLPLIFVCLALLIWEWLHRTKPHALDIVALPTALRWAIYYFIVALIFWYGVTGNVPFIYIKF